MTLQAASQWKVNFCLDTADKVNGTDQLRTQDDAICLEKVFNT